MLRTKKNNLYLACQKYFFYIKIMTIKIIFYRKKNYFIIINNFKLFYLF